MVKSGSLLTAERRSRPRHQRQSPVITTGHRLDGPPSACAWRCHCRSCSLRCACSTLTSPPLLPWLAAYRADVPPRTSQQPFVAELGPPPPIAPALDVGEGAVRYVISARPRFSRSHQQHS